MNKKILIIDDDKEYASILKEFIENDGYEVDYIEDEFKAIKHVSNTKYDLLLIDLQLKTLTGFQVVEVIRKNNPLQKIIILTSSASDNDEIKGLESGVEEYIRKSTSFYIMAKRIEKTIALENTNNKHSEILVDDKEGIVLNIRERTVSKNDEFIDLSFLEFELLRFFLDNKGKVLTRDEIMNEVWKVEANMAGIDVRTIDTHVKKIRSKLRLNSIYSIRSVGYRWHEA